jgi:hypothetical protein
MKTIAILTLLCLSFVQMYAQIDALKRALDKRNVDIESYILAHLEQSLEEIPSAVQDSLKKVPSNEMTLRLVKYLDAKKAENTTITSNDLGDFDWQYFTKEMNWVSLQLPCNSKTIFSAPDNRVIRTASGKCDWIAVPEKAYKPENGESVFTYLAPSGVQYEFLFGASMQGCEIYVESNPTGADVHINGNKYHHTTNTNSARPAGTYKVRISLAGYRDWNGEQFLAPGDVWKIDAKLTKQ